MLGKGQSPLGCSAASRARAVAEATFEGGDYGGGGVLCMHGVFKGAPALVLTIIDDNCPRDNSDLLLNPISSRRVSSLKPLSHHHRCLQVIANATRTRPAEAITYVV
jgi:hypothetical protein